MNEPWVSELSDEEQEQLEEAWRGTVSGKVELALALLFGPFVLSWRDFQGYAERFLGRLWRAMDDEEGDQ